MPPRCTSVPPGDRADSGKGCQLEHGHPGTHRCDQLVWHDPPLILVEGVQPDLTTDTDHWVDGQVRLTEEIR